MQRSIALRIGCFGAEPWSDESRRELEEALNIKAYDSYGLSEMMGPGVAFECQEQDGLHIWEDHFLIEILDKNEQPCAPGEQGELVITSLTKEAMPLIRYHTGDVTYIMEDKCPCGRTSRKLHRFLGRADDMLIVRGINVFPSQIEDVLVSIPEIGSYFQVIVDRKKHGLDEISIQVELKDEAFTGELSDLARIEKKTEEKIILDAFKKGDRWFNTGDMLINMGFGHAQFADRLGSDIAPLDAVAEVRQQGLMIGIELAAPADGLRWGRRVAGGACRSTPLPK